MIMDRINMGVSIVQCYKLLRSVDRIYYYHIFWDSRYFMGLKSVYLDIHSTNIFLVYG